MENGEVNTGTCCYVDGEFLSGKLIGYFNKTQPNAKPIYIDNRIVLGSSENDNSFEGFINANEVYPKIILTQCPLSLRVKTLFTPSTALPDSIPLVSTINDVKRMIIEQNIRMWVQLAPNADEHIIHNTSLLSTHITGTCALLPLELIPANQSPLLAMSEGVSEFNHSVGRLADGSNATFVHFSFRLTAYVLENNDHGSESSISFTEPVSEEGKGGLGEEVVVDPSSVAAAPPSLRSPSWRRVSRKVDHYWMYDWADYEPPPKTTLHTRSILYLADRAVELLNGSASAKLAINCQSGRGRSGTFAALVIGRLKKIQTTEELVREIVHMRESRDSIVETPEQFMYIHRTLQLKSDTYSRLNPRYYSTRSSAKSTDYFEAVDTQMFLCFLSGIIFTICLLLLSRISLSAFSRKTRFFRSDGDSDRESEVLISSNFPGKLS